jgi:hypothetical protein
VSVLYSRSERPEHFTDKALQAARKLAEIAARDDEDEPVPVQILTNRITTTVAASTVVNVDTILGPHSEAFGSIEGRIETISERKKPRFYIYDTLQDRPVRCYFEKDKFDEVVDIFKSRQRALIYGRIRYRRDGQPVSVRVDTLRPLNAPRLPSFSDVLGILRDDREDSE